MSKLKSYEEYKQEMKDDKNITIILTLSFIGSITFYICLINHLLNLWKL